MQSKTSGYDHAYLRAQPPKQTIDHPYEPDPSSGTYSHALFSLGVVLLEIILGSTIESMREPCDEVEMPGDESGIIRDTITVYRLLGSKVAMLCPAYKTVVERCVSSGQYVQHKDEDAFHEKVYTGVVAELEAFTKAPDVSVIPLKRLRSTIADAPVRSW